MPHNLPLPKVGWMLTREGGEANQVQHDMYSFSSAFSAPLREKKIVRAETAKDAEIVEGSVG